MKKVFRPHIILVTEGRFFLLFVIAMVALIIYMFGYFAFFQDVTDYKFIIRFLIFMLGMIALVAWLMYHFWPLIWGKLILEEEMIVWRCIFCKTVKMKYTDIQYVGIRGMGKRNVVPDIHHTGFRYLLISSITPPSKPIDKIRCGNGVIKWAVSEKVCEALKEKVPPQWKNILSSKRKM